MRIAFATFAILKEPYGSPVVQGFDDRTPDVFKEAERADGFIARAKEISGSNETNFNREWGDWGNFYVPNFYTLGRTNQTDQRASTISIWKDIGYVYRFVYSGLHLEALKKQKEWFLKTEWPTYAVWWIDDTHVPQWKEASKKIDQLHNIGASPSSFDFKNPFNRSGKSINLKDLKHIA